MSDNIDNRQFLQNLPDLGYNVYKGKIDNDVEKGYSFKCGCGATHLASESFAIREHDASAIYACLKNDLLLNLVVPEGFFRVKGIKTIASYFSTEDDPLYASIFAFRDMREKGFDSLSDYYKSYA